MTVEADVSNNADRSVRAMVAGVIRGPGGAALRLRDRLTLNPGEQRTVHLTTSLDRPRVWWPAGMGEQPLYELRLAARSRHQVSDRAQLTFGLREVSSRRNEHGDRQFYVNGEPFFVRAAGYTSDIFLRYRPDYIEDQFRYWRDLGLNAVRLEGKLEHPEFYDLADRYGIMVLPGWECCDKWESNNPEAYSPGEEWNDADFRVAGESMAHEARMLRNHPSVLAFLVGSDFWPIERLETIYLDALRDADWDAPVISSAATRGGYPPQLGPSGMKMDGPYDWVPPNYWYGDKLGAAFGFASELGSGAGTPELDSLRRFLSPADLRTLWQDPDAPMYHMSAPGSTFDNREIYNEALFARYGRPTSLADYVATAQVADYEAVRAQFEAYARNSGAERPATGLVYWMLNNGWPSLHWHLYDYYLDPAGTYFGVKKANEPLHVQYSYDDRSVVVVNRTQRTASDLRVTAKLANPDGTALWRDRARQVTVEPGETPRVLTVPEPAEAAEAYFLKLTVRDGSGATVSRNIYWRSRQPDVLDWDNSTWYYTPVSDYASFVSLRDMPQADVRVQVRTRPRPGGRARTAVTLRNTSSDAIAFFNRLTLRGRDGAQVLPIRWSTNDVTLWPGEALRLHAEYDVADLHGARPTVQVKGWNLAGGPISVASQGP